MFPDAPYIQIGGDEPNTDNWEKCSECQKYMKEHGLKNVRELYTDYVARVTDYVFTLGKIPMVYEGFPPEGTEKINKDTIVFAWDSSFHLAPDLLKAGFKIIDADKVAHKVMEKGTPCLNQVIEVFGKEYLNENGELVAIFDGYGNQSLFEYEKYFSGEFERKSNRIKSLAM